MSVIDSATAVSKGGRNGHVEVKNTNLAFDMVADGGLNPEQLFSATYASCWGNALIGVIKMEKADVAEPVVTLTVNLNYTKEKGPFLEANINAFIKGADQVLADKLVKKANELCPYSRAMKGNIEISVHAEV